jgi:hypothetical protein
MAFTQADVDAIDRAIASGEKSVQIDGKLIVNDTIEALEKRKAHILACLRNGSSGTSSGAQPRHKLASFADTDTL